jgi:LPS-assembly protein
MAIIENTTMRFQADRIDYDGETGDLHASGRVHFRHFERNEEIWADKVDYNTDEETGKFYNIRGTGQPRMDARKGVLTSSSPFYFQGKWAERVGNRYILHDGFITDCKMPRPWWRLVGPRFDIAPGERALAYRTMFKLRKLPLFYTPFFYKALEREPRHTGFLTPNIGNSSRRGKMVGLGYFWAINRSYDLTYLFQDFTQRGFAHHVDFRAKPNARTEFNAILYGVQDRGLKQNGVYKEQPAGGATVSVSGKSDLGDGFTAQAQINYLTSLRFRQTFTESFNEAVFSEVHSVGVVDKSWSSFTANLVFARLENFQRAEVVDPGSPPDRPRYETDAVLIRKLPEVDLVGRDRRIWSRLPVWISFESSAGLLYRTQPVFQNDVLIDRYQTGQFMDRVNFAPRVSTALHWHGIHLVPSFTLHETYYGEGQAPYLDRMRVSGINFVRSARDIGVDLVFPTLTRIFPRRTWLGDKLKHVIEPRAAYRYVTGFDDFQRVVRFDETDLLSNTNEVEISLTNRLYAKRGDAVEEIFSWQLVQKRYFDPTFGGAITSGQRNVVWSEASLTPFAFLDRPRVQSPVVSVLRASPRPGFGLEWRADYDPVRGGIVNSGFSVDYRRSHYFISAGHSQVHADPLLTPNANQFRTTVGFGEANKRGWSAASTAVYDYRQGILQYTTTQVTYNTDCCGVSVQFRRFSFGTRNDNQYRVAFAVANIGNFGTLKKQERMF